MILPFFFSAILTSAVAATEVPYRLIPGSTFQEGCVGPCLCPIGIEEEVTGTFTLTPAGSDPLFTNYNLEKISWTVTDFNQEVAHRITGQGTYRLGGEVALTHQLILDLSIDGADPARLDSGLIQGGPEFPAISASVNRGTFCFNIWMDINAAPLKEDFPIAELEYPIPGQTVSGVLPIYGWALDEEGVTKLELLIDDQFIGNIPYGGTRTDVKEAYPDYPDAENSGFAMILNCSTLAPGDHSLKVRVFNQDAQIKDLEAQVTVKRFQGESVEEMKPARKWLRNQSVTAAGVTKRYDIKLEWSEKLQNFEITDVIRR